MRGGPTGQPLSIQASLPRPTVLATVGFFIVSSRFDSYQRLMVERLSAMKAKNGVERAQGAMRFVVCACACPLR
jgi:hypothetical protein